MTDRAVLERKPDDSALRLWRDSVKVTTLWTLVQILLFTSIVLTRRMDQLEELLLGPLIGDLSAAWLITAGNLALGIYLLLDLVQAWKMKGPARRGHLAGVVLAIVLTCVLQVGIELLSEVAREFAAE